MDSNMSLTCLQLNDSVRINCDCSFEHFKKHIKCDVLDSDMYYQKIHISIEILIGFLTFYSVQDRMDKINFMIDNIDTKHLNTTIVHKLNSYGLFNCSLLHVLAVSKFNISETEHIYFKMCSRGVEPKISVRKFVNNSQVYTTFIMYCLKGSDKIRDHILNNCIEPDKEINCIMERNMNVVQRIIYNALEHLWRNNKIKTEIVNDEIMYYINKGINKEFVQKWQGEQFNIKDYIELLNSLVDVTECDFYKHFKDINSLQNKDKQKLIMEPDYNTIKLVMTGYITKLTPKDLVSRTSDISQIIKGFTQYDNQKLKQLCNVISTDKKTTTKVFDILRTILRYDKYRYCDPKFNLKYYQNIDERKHSFVKEYLKYINIITLIKQPFYSYEQIIKLINSVNSNIYVTNITKQNIISLLNMM